LSADRRQIVGVKVLLYDLVERATLIQQDRSTDQEDNIGGTDSLLNNLKGADGHGCSGVNASTDNDETKSHTDNDINNADDEFQEDSELETGHSLGNFICCLLGLLPFNEDPTHGNGSVNGSDNGDDGEDTGSQSGPS